MQQATDKRAPYDYNAATLDGKRGKCAEWPASSKEEVNRLRVVTGEAGNLRTAIDARFWMGRSRNASTVTCSAWIHLPDNSDTVSGRGSAGGYGYHKESAALEDALHNAGVKLEKHFGGAGDGAMVHALVATARAAGWDGNLEVI